MAFTTTAVKSLDKPASQQPDGNNLLSPLLGMLVLSVYTAQKSKKAFRKMKRRFLWTAFKLKVKSFFSRKADISDRTLIYILIGIIALILVFYYPVIALLVALALLILILADKI
jgi:hypothetical protein